MLGINSIRGTVICCALKVEEKTMLHSASAARCLLFVSRFVGVLPHPMHSFLANLPNKVLALFTLHCQEPAVQQVDCKNQFLSCIIAE